MITERIQQQNPNLSATKYYQFSTILEHVIDCFHTIVSDETNPYYPPLAWLTRKNVKPPDDELFLDLIEQCSMPKQQQQQQPISDTINNNSSINNNNNSSHNASDNNRADETQGGTIRELSPASRNQIHRLSSSVSYRLSKCSPELRKDIVSRKKDGCTPLFLACRHGHVEIVKYLLDSCNADIEQKGLYETLEDHHVHSVSPLWVAAVSGNIDIVRLLIERGANVNSVSDTGSTTLRSVCFLCRDDDNQKNSDNSIDRVDADFEFDQVPADEVDVYMDIVRLLVENGANVMKPNYNGGTCLINSIHNYALTRYILDHGASIDATDYQFKTALHYAIQQGRFEVTKLLLSRGASKDLRANLYDDALQLACLGAHVRIFELLIDQFRYSRERLVDAYKLLGSSILELHFDLTRVRRYWKIALHIQNYDTSRGHNEANCDHIMIIDDDNGGCISVKYLADSSPSPISSLPNCCTPKRRNSIIDGNFKEDDRNGNEYSVRDRRFICDNWRSKAFSDMKEFSSIDDLDFMSTDSFRIQSLLISERVLGLYHRETIQRLLYRGTFYINSLQPERCINLWIYALKLRLEYDSIFHFEPIFAAQAITRLFLDLLSQQRLNQTVHHPGQQHLQLNLNRRQRFDYLAFRNGEQFNLSRPMPDDNDSVVKFGDVYDVIVMLLEELDECKKHLSAKPASVLHEDIFDLLLAIIVNLLFVLKCVTRLHEIKYSCKGSMRERNCLMKEIVRKLIRIDPRTTSTGATLLHLILAPTILDGDMHRLLSSISDNVGRDSSQESQPHFLPTTTTTAVAENTKCQEKAPMSQLARIVFELVELFLDGGFYIDSTDGCGHSAMQVLCLTNVRCNADKNALLRRLVVDCGAHVDRHTAKPEQRELIWQSLREAGINPRAYVTLACLAASKVAERSSSLSFDTNSVSPTIRRLIAMH